MTTNSQQNKTIDLSQDFKVPTFFSIILFSIIISISLSDHKVDFDFLNSETGKYNYIT